jgi:hypothetical protein
VVSDSPTFAERVAVVLDELEAVTTWAQRRAVTREREGRRLSASSREQLVRLADRARAAAEALDALVASPEVDEDPDAITRARASAELERLRGVIRPSYTPSEHFDGLGPGPSGSDSRAGIRRGAQVPMDTSLPGDGQS